MSIKRAQFFGSVEVESNLNYLAQQRRIQRIKDVREQERRISATRNEKYRECINDRKAMKTSVLRQCKVEKLENVKQELVYQWQSALVNTGHAHRGAVEETKRRRIEKNAEERHLQQLNEVSRQRELAALRLRQQQILDMQQHAIEVRQLKKVRDELKLSEREDAHEAGVSFATRQKMLDNERAWREYHTNGHSVKDETKKITQSAVSIEQRFPVKVRARVLRHGTGPRDMKMIINSASDEETAQMKRMWGAVMSELISRKIILQRAKAATIKVTSERGVQFLEDELKLLETVDKANARMSRIVSADKILDVDEENMKVKNRFEHIFMSRAIDHRPTAPAPTAVKPVATSRAAERIPQPSMNVPKPTPAAPSPKWTVLRSVASTSAQQSRRNLENDVFQMFPATVEDDCDSCVSSALSNVTDDDSLNYPPVSKQRYPVNAPAPPVLQQQQQVSPPPPPPPAAPAAPAAPTGKQAIAALPLNLQKSPPPTILVDFTPRDYSNGDSGDKANMSGVINGSWLAEQVDVLSKKGKQKKSTSKPSAVHNEPLPERPKTATAASIAARQMMNPPLSREPSDNSPLLPAPITIPHLQSFTSVDSRNISSGSDDTPVARHDAEVSSPVPVRKLDSHIVAATPSGAFNRQFSFGSGASSSGSDVAAWQKQSNVNISTSESSHSSAGSHVVSPDRSSLVEQSLRSSSVHSVSSSGSSREGGRILAPTTPHRGAAGARSNPFQLSSAESSAIVSPVESPFRPALSRSDGVELAHDLSHPSQRVSGVPVDASLDSTMTADSISALYASTTAAATRISQFSSSSRISASAAATSAVQSTSGAIVFDDSSDELDPDEQSSLYADYQQLNEMLSQSALTEPSTNAPVAAATSSASYRASGSSNQPTLIKPPTTSAATAPLGKWSVTRSVDESIESPSYSLRSSDSSFAFNEQLSRQSIPEYTATAVGGRGVDDSFGGLSLASSQSSVVFPPRDYRYSTNATGGVASAAARAQPSSNADDSFLSGGDLSLASQSTESSVVFPKSSGTAVAVASSSSVSSSESGQPRSPVELGRRTLVQTSTPLTNYSLTSGGDNSGSVGVPAVGSSSGMYGTSILTVNSLSRSSAQVTGGEFERKVSSRSGSSSGSSSVVIPGIAVDDSVEYEESDADEGERSDVDEGYLSEQSLDSLA